MYERLLQMRGVRKDYRSLRPLRVAHLEVAMRESVALLGFDQPMAEVFIDLLTGRSVPDEGEVVTLGRPTTAIPDADAWIATLDRFGIVSERAVLVGELSVEQTLALSFSFALDTLSSEVKGRVEAIGREVGLGTELQAPVGSLAPLSRMRLRLGRALAPDPSILLLDHPTATLSAHDASLFAADVKRVVADRPLATVVLTADRAFAEAAADNVLTLQPATGELRRLSGWKRWFG